MNVKRNTVKRTTKKISKLDNKNKSLKPELYDDLIDKNFLNFIKDQEEGKIWNPCQTKIFYKKYKKKEYLLPEPSSNEQISIFYKKLMKKKNKYFYLNRFYTLLTYFVSHRYASSIINKIRLNPEISDREIIEYIRGAPKNDLIPGIYESDNENNIKNNSPELEDCPEKVFEFNMIYDNFIKIFKKIYDIPFNKENIKLINYRYLDIGCGNGKKTELFGKIFDFPKNMIYGTDIENWGPYSSSKKFNFQFEYILKNGKLNFPDNYFGLVTCFFTLHHVPNLTNIINEIKRILIPNGLIIIIEHDVIDYFDGLIVGIQHLMYSYLRDYYKNKKAYKNYITHPDFSRYFNTIEWDYILKKHNFQYKYGAVLYSSMLYLPTYDNQYYSIYQNIK